MPTVVTQYPVQDGQPLLIDVLIGDLQAGGTSIFLGTTEMMTQTGDVVDFEIGRDEQLRGRTMVISTVVLDRNPMTDFTSAVVVLDGGAHLYRNLGGDVPGDDLWRVDIGLDVELRDGLWLTSTFGRDFNARDARSLLAIANLQWNIGDRSIQPVTR